MIKYADLKDVLGKVFTSVVRVGDTIYFYADEQNGFYLEHEQECCEVVTLEDIVGDLADLAGNQILVAEESSNEELGPSDNVDVDGYYDSYTWTFYKFATIKGWVDIRFFGTSNGYYSEKAQMLAFSGVKLPSAPRN